MNAITDNAYRRAWGALGAQFGNRYGKPTAILCISAHWLTRGTWITAMDKPRTIHDFGGFPQALFDQQYPAPGSPALASQTAKLVTVPPMQLDQKDWGLDHGTWSVLKPMFPAADIPVLQLSMDYSQSAAHHYAIGQQLAALRDQGVLIVGSGNVVHNLRAARDANPYDWALEFDQYVGQALARGDHAALIDFQKNAALAQLAHPTYEHYLPLLYALGAASGSAKKAPPPAIFNEGWQLAAISMRSMIWEA
jgi:4,5-DOPA dioxygenase extradiol